MRKKNIVYGVIIICMILGFVLVGFIYHRSYVPGEDKGFERETEIPWDEVEKVNVKIEYKNCNYEEKEDLTTMIDEDGYVYLIHKNKEDEVLEGDLPREKLINFASSLYGVITIDTHNLPEDYVLEFVLDYDEDTFEQVN